MAKICATIALLGWRLPNIEHPTRGWRVARRAAFTAAGLAVLALIAGIPPAYEAGRLIGFAAGAMLVARVTGPDDASALVRVRRTALASLLYAAAW